MIQSKSAIIAYLVILTFAVAYQSFVNMEQNKKLARNARILEEDRELLTKIENQITYEELAVFEMLFLDGTVLKSGESGTYKGFKYDTFAVNSPEHGEFLSIRFHGKDGSMTVHVNKKLISQIIAREYLPARMR